MRFASEKEFVDYIDLESPAKAGSSVPSGVDREGVHELSSKDGVVLGFASERSNSCGET